MKKDFLLDAIGQIDDELILDAEQAPPLSQAEEQKSSPRPFPTRWRYWGGLAAALAVCVGLWAGIASGVLPVFRMGSGSSNAPMSPGLSGGQGNMAPTSEADGFDVYVTAGSKPPSEEPAPDPDEAASDDSVINGGVTCEPSAPGASEGADKQAEAQIFIAGGRYVPGVSADRSPLDGTALGKLTCPAWGLGADGEETEENGEEGNIALTDAPVLRTNVPEYDGLTVWAQEGRYFLELSDGSFLTLVLWEG